MPAQNQAFKDRLFQVEEIKITVTGRKSGHSISYPCLVRRGGQQAVPGARAGSETAW